MSQLLLRRYALVTILLLASTAFAQSVSFGVSLAGQNIKTSLSLADLDAEGVRLSLRFATGVYAPFELGVAARSTTLLGPLGNVVIDGDANVNALGQFDGFAQVAGTLASVAGLLRLEAYNVDPGRFEPARAYSLEARPRYLLDGDVGVSLTAGVTYRLERALILVAEPGLTWVSNRGLGARLSSTLQLRGLVERDDGHLLLLAEVEPGGAAGFVAAGFEYRLNRSDYPLLRAAALLGAGSPGLWPGARLSLGGSVAEVAYNLGLAVEPYRSTGPRYRGAATLRGPLGSGELGVALFFAPGATGASLSYSYGF